MTATISDCGHYRYRLERDLGHKGPTVAVIMVNPSTADAETDDATIRKLKGFGRRLGWGRFIVGNLFAYRATDVQELRFMIGPAARGPDNNDHLSAILAEADLVIVAWGSANKLPPGMRSRWTTVVKLIAATGKTAMCFGMCGDGHPRHPLMLAYETPLTDWKAP